MVTVEFDSMGEAVRLALVAGEYVDGGLAVLLLDATDPRSDGYMAEWGVLTASVPAAAEWCRGRGNIAIDADAPAALLEALEAAGTVRMADRSAASGMARYPRATVAGHALAVMASLPETLEEALGSTVSSSTSRAATAARSRWGPRRRARPSSSASSPPRGPRPTRWQPPADGRPSGSVSGTPRPSTARRAERSTWPGRNSCGRHPHGHAGDGVPLAAFPGDGPRHPRTPARQRAEAPWDPYDGHDGNDGTADTCLRASPCPTGSAFRPMRPRRDAGTPAPRSAPLSLRLPGNAPQGRVSYASAHAGPGR